jgi:hypothetical protein
MDAGERTTGTRDVHYNLVSVLYHALHGAENCEIYALDAEAAGDARLAGFFREAQEMQRQLAERAKELLGIEGGVRLGTTAPEAEIVPPRMTEEAPPPPRTAGMEEGVLPRTEERPPSRTEEVPLAEEVPSGTPPQAPPGDVQRETPPEPSSRTQEPPGPLGREGSRRPESEQDEEEDKGLLDRARDALLGKEDEPRRREGTDRPDRR